MRKLIILLTIALTALLASAGSDVSFTVKVPSRVLEGEKFALTYSLRNGDGTALRTGDIPGCSRLYGPSVSKRQSYEVVNGQMSSSSSVDYTYTYRADKAGTYTLPAASIVVDGKQYTTKPVEFTIVDNPGGGSNTQQGSNTTSIDDIRTQRAGKDVSASDVMVRIILSKPSAYEQEAIECTIKLYTKYQISSFRATAQPSFDGFLIEDLDIQSALNNVETYNGQDYRTAVLKRCIIFPQKSGKLTINSGNYELTVVQYEEIPMGFFVTRQPVEKDVNVRSNSASVEVKPLPEPKPAGFDGAVGTFTAECHPVGASYRTGDPMTLMLTVNGTGNIKYINEPQPDVPSEFEQYTPAVDRNTRVSGSTVTGSMTVEYTYVPQTVGNFTVNMPPFSYFNPADGQYHTITFAPFDFKVAKGLSTNTSRDTERKDIEAKNTDIRFINTGDLGLAKPTRPVARSLWYWSLWLIVLLLAIGATTMRIRHARAMGDVAGRRMGRAAKVAQSRMRKAAALGNSGQTSPFVEELLKALWGYLSDKLGIPASRLSRDNIREAMEQRYGEPGIQAADSVTAVLDECELTRYTPGGQASEATDSLLRQASDAIAAIERLKLSKH